MCERLSAKPIALRPSNEEQAIIKAYMQTNKIKKPSKALKEIVREFSTLQNLSKKEAPSIISPLEREKATGHLIKCPQWNISVPYEDPLTKWNPPVDTSVCVTCPKYPCETWEDLKSTNRVAPDPLVKATLNSINKFPKLENP